MTEGGTVRGLLAGAAPTLPALSNVHGSSLTYDELASCVDRVAGQLGRLGVGRDTPVAIVLPNGPAAAVAFLAATVAGIAAPINPGLRPAEVERLLTSLGSRVVITSREPPAALAGLGGLSVGVLDDEDLRSGLVSDGRPLSAAVPSPPEPQDVALLLHTSGTTAAPKKVPITHRSLAASARTIADWFELSPADRCLSVMPLFHIHGLVGALLASMAAGAAVTCTPGFDAFKFFGWLEAHRPSWFSAVPTIHQLILARAGRGAEPPHSLRFMRSSSAALPPTVMRDMEALFDAPMLEAFGMTEATHQMAANPLPPAVRKPGSVGLPTGIELGVLVDGSVTDAPQVPGEVVVRGVTVQQGYLDAPAGTNEAAFHEGWFRTGDLGSLDEDGYLYLAGRLKEIINRGGENISPREIDEALLEHPAIRQAAAFAMPDKWLGEAVGAVVVLEDDYTESEARLRAYLRDRLASFKVPEKIVIADEIPKGPTGKVQRMNLAELLGLGDRRAS